MICDRASPLGRIVGREKYIERNVKMVRIAVEHLPVRISQLYAFHDGMDELVSNRIHLANVETFEERQRLEHHGTLSPGSRFVNGHAVVVAGYCWLEAGLVSGEIGAGEQAAVPPAGRVNQFGRPIERVHRFGDEPLIEAHTRRINLLSPVATSGFTFR